MSHHFCHGSLLSKMGRYRVHIVHVWQDCLHQCHYFIVLGQNVKMAIKIHNSKIVTDKQVYWASPSNSDTFLRPEILFNIDFKSPQFKKKSIEKQINSSSTIQKDGLNSPPLKRKSPITKVMSSEMDIFFENLMKSDKNLRYCRFSQDMLKNVGQNHLIPLANL